VVAIDYLTKFAKVRALKSSLKEKNNTIFVWTNIQFGTSLKIVSNNGPQFFNNVMGNLLTRLVVKHRFSTMCKSKNDQYDIVFHTCKRG
jgi:hypothetical protein